MIMMLTRNAKFSKKSQEQVDLFCEKHPDLKDALSEMVDFCVAQTYAMHDENPISLTREYLREMLHVWEYKEDDNHEGRAKCHDCGASEGEFHQPGCDMEKCPFCGGQLISCSCCYEKLGLIDHDKYPLTDGLPREIYENGLSESLEKKWDKMLHDNGLIPWIQYPVICQRCGQLWPDLFSVPDEEWKKYIEPRMQDTVICRSCYDLIKSWIDCKVKNVEKGKAGSSD